MKTIHIARKPAAQLPAMAVAVLAMLATAALLAACAGSPDFKRPEPPHADRYTADKLAIESGSASGKTTQQVEIGAKLTGEWWQLFHSDEIDGLVKQALASNRTLAAASATLSQSQEVAAALAGTAAPQVGVTAGVGRQKYGAEFLGTLPKPPAFTYYAVGPSISYTFDYAGGIARSVEQKYALAEYQRRQLEGARLAVSGNAVMLAIRIASLKEQIATVDEILQRDRDNVKLVGIAFDAGSVSRVDVLSADSQLAADTTLLAPLRQDLSVARHALAVVLGQTPATANAPEIDIGNLLLPRSLPVSLPSELAHQRPDILAAEAQLHAATAAVGIANANLYPHITLSASTGQQTVDLPHLFERASNVWSLISGITAPIFDGGTLRAEKRAAIDAMHASAATYEQTVLVAFSQVADSLEALEHDAQQLEAQARAQESAKANLDLTQRSYQEGDTGVLQVLDAKRLYQQARLGYVRANAQRYLDTAQLYLALGGSEAPGNIVADAK